MRKLDPFDEDDYQLMVQISLDHDLPLRFLLKSEVKMNISVVEISFNSDLENLEINIANELEP